MLRYISSIQSLCIIHAYVNHSLPVSLILLFAYGLVYALISLDSIPVLTYSRVNNQCCHMKIALWMKPGQHSAAENIGSKRVLGVLSFSYRNVTHCRICMYIYIFQFMYYFMLSFTCLQFHSGWSILCTRI